MVKLHPITQITLVIWISTIALSSANLAVLSGLMFASALLCLVNRKNPLRSLLRLLPLYIIVFILQILFRTEGEVLWSYGSISVTVGGLMIAVQVVLRLSIIYLSAVLLVNLQFNDFRNAFSLIRVPVELSFMVSFVIHFLPLLSQRFMDAVILLRYRGLDLRRNSLPRKIGIYRIIILTVLTGMLYNVSYQAIALELRGFRSPGIKTVRSRTGLALPDWSVFLVLMIAGASILIHPS